MKIRINTDEKAEDVTIEITCSKLTKEIEKILSLIRMINMQVIGKKEGETFLLDSSQIMYIDTADKKTFIYTREEIYESNLRLYELEEQLTQTDFFRANKSCIINIRHIKSLKADIDGRIRVTLKNGEQLMVNRQYAGSVKRKLGI